MHGLIETGTMKVICTIKAQMWNRTTEMDIRRAFTAFQLMTILEENHHTLVLIEHDPLLYDGAAELVEDISRAISKAAKKAAVLLYSPGG